MFGIIKVGRIYKIKSETVHLIIKEQSFPSARLRITLTLCQPLIWKGKRNSDAGKVIAHILVGEYRQYTGNKEKNI